MIVRIQLRKGPRVARKAGKNRNAAFTAAALLKPLALMAYVLGVWRLASDMGMAGAFVFTGLFSHWQVWMGMGVLVHVLSYALSGYGSSGELRWPRVFSVQMLMPKKEKEAEPAQQRRMAAGR
jgi:hypothetical protein